MGSMGMNISFKLLHSSLKSMLEEALLMFTLKDTSGFFLIFDTIIQDPSFHGSLESTCLSIEGTRNSYG